MFNSKCVYVCDVWLVLDTFSHFRIYIDRAEKWEIVCHSSVFHIFNFFYKLECFRVTKQQNICQFQRLHRKRNTENKENSAE